MLASPRRLSFPLLSCLVLVLIAVFSGPASAAPDYSTIKINEVQSDPDDLVELTNTGSAAVDISGLVIRDSEEVNAFTIPAGTVLAAKAYAVFAVNVKDSTTAKVGLGKGDSVRLFDGTTLLDSTTWPTGTHATTWGRCPDGTGPFGVTAASLGAANQCIADPTRIRINEVRSNGGNDFVELINTGSLPVDITGWTAVDNDVAHTPAVFAPSGTTIAAGGYFSFETDAATMTGHFGLGSTDSITVSQANGSKIDSYSWTEHRTPSFGRCVAGTGDFVLNATATPGALNDCPVPAGARSVKINEVESNPLDKVELVNTGSAAVDLSGFVLKDEGNDPYVVPSGTTIGAGAFLVIDPSAVFKLGKGDSARLFAPGAETLLDSTTWPVDTHAEDWGRCPGGTGAFTAVTRTLGLPNECAAPADPKTVIRINEVESNGDKVADWVELTNTGSSTVDISGWKILDNDAAHAATPVVVPAKTTIAPGAFYAIYTEVNQSPGFGLGGADSATLLLADGTTVVDTYAWTAHAATTYGRCPDGTGAFKITTTSTRGASNACSPVRINEIESDAGTGADWVELVNISDAPVDVSGWTVKDSGDTGAVTFAAGTTIAARSYRVVEGLTLDASDSVRLLGSDGTTVVESYGWTSPATVTYGRCVDGLGDFTTTTAATKGSANACPGLATDVWPGSQSVRTADLAGTFVQDLSGLVFDPKNPDVLWAAQNKLGTLFKLVRDGQSWVPDSANGWGAGKTPKYTDGTGAPDTEGLTIGPDGFIYAASERNNSASGVSRMSVLRYDPNATGTTLTATDEWDLTGKIPAAGANLGLEGATWVPDTFLTAGGFVDQSTKAPYKPSDYPLHGTGLYVVAVEDTGALHAFALDSTGGTSHLVATITSGFPHLADVTFDPERQRLWAVTDDTVDGKTSLLQLTNGAFTVAEAYDRPAAMPNLNNEGFALAPQSRCVDGSKEVVWSDDGDTGGFSLRTGTIRCTALPTQPAPTNPGTGPVADMTAPSVRIGGVTRNRLYTGSAPRARCISTDAGSGIASCTIARTVTPTRTTLTATAVDRAGNVGTATTSYRTLAYRVSGATYRGGKFLLERGRAYRLVGTVRSSGRVHGPAPLGTTARATARLRNGQATVRIPRSARIGSTWKIVVKTGSTSHTIKVKVTR
jgi:hypothetical protein